jgi:hypothetical protein
VAKNIFLLTQEELGGFFIGCFGFAQGGEAAVQVEQVALPDPLHSFAVKRLPIQRRAATSLPFCPRRSMRFHHLPDQAGRASCCQST